MEQGETLWAKHINNGAGRNTVGKTHEHNGAGPNTVGKAHEHNRAGRNTVGKTHEHNGAGRNTVGKTQCTPNFQYPKFHGHEGIGGKLLSSSFFIIS